MNRRDLVRGLALLGLMSVGCGTLNNTVSGTPLADGRPSEPPNVVYGGTLSSLEEGYDCVIRPNSLSECVGGVYLLAIDAPLSLVGDTLTLPITIPAAIDRGVDAY